MTPAEFQTFKSELKDEILNGSIDVFPFSISTEFIDWFIKTGKFYENSYTILPDNIIVNKSFAGNCFQNSQLLSIENDEMPYIEGVMRGVKFQQIIHHGFNLFNEKVLDVTFLNNRQQIIDETRDTTFFYFGVEICKNFIENLKVDLASMHSNNPLIQQYYDEHSKC